MPDAPRPTPWAPHLLPLMRPFSGRLALAGLAMTLDSLFTALRPWPLKVVIDKVLNNRTTRVPFIGHWLNTAGLSPTQVLYGACAATLLIALSTGVLTYFFTRTMGNVARHYAASLRRVLFAHMQRLSL